MLKLIKNKTDSYHSNNWFPHNFHEDLQNFYKTSQENSTICSEFLKFQVVVYGIESIGGAIGIQLQLLHEEYNDMGVTDLEGTTPEHKNKALVILHQSTSPQHSLKVQTTGDMAPWSTI